MSALFRDAVSAEQRWPRRRFMIGAAAAVAMLAGFAVIEAYDRRIALIFIAAAAAVFVALQLVGLLLMWIARRMPHSRITAVRLVFRPSPCLAFRTFAAPPLPSLLPV